MNLDHRTAIQIRYFSALTCGTIFLIAVTLLHKTGNLSVLVQSVTGTYCESGDGLVKSTVFVLGRPIVSVIACSDANYPRVTKFSDLSEDEKAKARVLGSDIR